MVIFGQVERCKFISRLWQKVIIVKLYRAKVTSNTMEVNPWITHLNPLLNFSLISLRFMLMERFMSLWWFSHNVCFCYNPSNIHALNKHHELMHEKRLATFHLPLLFCDFGKSTKRKWVNELYTIFSPDIFYVCLYGAHSTSAWQR